MKVLLSGGTGFLGTYVVKALLSKGYRVALLVRGGLGGKHHGVVASEEIPRLPVGERYEEVPGHVRDFAPDVVIHLAAISRPGPGPDGIRELVDANVTFGSILLEAMVQHDVPNFVNCGTSWQTDVNGAYSPFNLYAATKQAFEDIIVNYSADGLRTISLRVFDTFGPLDTRGRIVDLLLDSALQKKPIDVTKGTQVIDLVDVRDVASAFTLAAERVSTLERGQTEIFGINALASTQVRDIADTIERVTGQAPFANWGAREYRAREIMFPCRSLAQLPGWMPTISVDDTIRDMWDAKRASLA